jgi:hypothetical protein
MNISNADTTSLIQGIFIGRLLTALLACTRGDRR